MANPNIPPEIAKKIAAMKAPAPAAGPAPKAAPAAPAPKLPGRWIGKLAVAGWIVAVLASAAAYLQYTLADQQKSDALAAQTAAFDQQLAEVKAEHAAKLAEGEARIRKVTDDAMATAASIQVELDYAKMPEIPLKTQVRPGQVLYIENESDEAVSCKVRMFRPIGAVTKEYDFSMKNRTYKDLAAIEDWLFQKGDTLTFTKPGYKPRELTIQ